MPSTSLTMFLDSCKKSSQVKEALLKPFELEAQGYPDPEDRTFNRVISDIYVVPRETTLTITDSIEIGSTVETEIVRVVSLNTTEITGDNTI